MFPTVFEAALRRGDVARVSAELDASTLITTVNGQGVLTRAFAALVQADPLDKGPLRVWRLLLREGALEVPPGPAAHLVALAQVTVPAASRVQARQALRDLGAMGVPLDNPFQEQTPLAAALALGNPHWARLLLEAGARPVDLPPGPPACADARILHAQLAEQAALANLRQVRGQAPRRRGP